MPFKSGHIERVSARSRKLEEFDQLAWKALGERKLRHEEWKGWKSKPAPIAGVRLLKRHSLLATESTMVINYDRAGQINPLPQKLMVSSDLPQRHGSETIC